MESTINKTVLLQAAEVELIYKSKVKPSLRPRAKTPKEAYEIIIANWDFDKIELKEEFKVMLLDRSNKVLGIYALSSGGITGTVADPRLIFSAALKANAVSIIIVHNHPSGTLKASRSDIDLTIKIKEAGRYLEIEVLDSMIITSEGYLSLTEEGLL